MKPTPHILPLILALATLSCQPSTRNPQSRIQNEPVYLFSYFLNNGEDGLHLAYSTDGYHFSPLNDCKPLLTPHVGEERLMRDPCILLGPDGLFHMVWTTSWRGKTIGYANSPDLTHWSEQKAIPVMADEPKAQNCWAPEIVYDETHKHFMIFWSTTIPGRFPETDGGGDGDCNHRLYYTTTIDFQTFAPTKLLYDPGFDVIDATFLRDGQRLWLIIKRETLKPLAKNLSIVSAASFTGPFTDLSAPFTAAYTEGPTALRIGDEYLVYFDCYTKNHFGAVRSRDLKQWQDVTDKISFPPGVRHGTIIAIPRSILSPLLKGTLSGARTSATTLPRPRPVEHPSPARD